MASADLTMHSSETLAPTGGITAGDLFVVVATGIVAMALTVGLTAQVGLDLHIAVGMAIGSFLAMIAGHAALRRAEAPRRRHRLDDIPTQRTELRADQTTRQRKSEPTLDATSKAASTNDKVKLPLGAEKSALRNDLGRDQRGMPQKVASKDINYIPQDVPALKEGSPSLNRSGSSNRAQPTFEKALPRELAHQDALSNENIDEMIKRLAGDIESGRKKPSDSMTDFASLAANRDEQVAPPPIPVAERRDVPKASEEPSQPGKIAKAHKLPPTMREAARMPLPAAAPVTPPSPAVKLAAIADALSDEQLDVFLETINGLKDYRAQHYEVSIRLRLADGQKLASAEFISETRGTGLLPLLEAVKVSSTKRLAVQMINRGRTGEFFTSVDGEALSEQQFGQDIATITGSDDAMASRLVLAFTQADVRMLTPAQLYTLETVAGLGFRFSIEAITDLDMDFEALATRGFTFAKLDADVFLGGLPMGVARLPSGDICRHLGEAGLTVIVDKITDERARAQILEFGAVLGQGALFGKPRPVRADVLRPGETREQTI